MGLAELVSRLESEAEARVSRMRADADAQVRALRAASEVDARREREAILASRAAERRARLDLELARARQHARHEEVDAERAMVDRVLARVGELLERVEDDPAYLAGLPERVEELLRFAPAAVVIRCRPSLARVAREVAARHPGATCEVVDAMPVGIQLLARDGSMEVDDTLPTRLERHRALLAATVVGRVRP